MTGLRPAGGRDAVREPDGPEPGDRLLMRRRGQIVTVTVRRCRRFRCLVDWGVVVSDCGRTLYEYRKARWVRRGRLFPDA